MKKPIFAGFAGLLAATSLISSPALALEVKLGGISSNDNIPPSFAFCTKDGKGKTQPSTNLNPQIRWSGAPDGTKSYALLVVDPDVPASFDDANKEGKTIPENVARKDFYHWVLVDIPVNIESIKQGQDSSSYKESGKPVGRTTYGINGPNDFGTFMKGTFGGYDGPCPPWNDERVHNYHFRVYAVDVETLGISPENANGRTVEKLLSEHTLAMGEVVANFSNKP